MHEENLLVIGASSALGIEFLSKHGSRYTNVIAHCNSHSIELESLARKVIFNIQIVSSDLNTEGGPQKIINTIELSGLQIDFVAFFAAPRLHIKRFHKLAWEDFQRHINVQTRTTFQLMKYLLPSMGRRNHGKFVFVMSSVLNCSPPQGMADYVVGKYTLLGLIKSAAVEYAGRHICINAVSPSMIDTPFIGEIPRSMVEMNAEAHPRGANATPAELVSIVNFLLSDAAGYITGQNIIATGGA